MKRFLKCKDRCKADIFNIIFSGLFEFYDDTTNKVYLLSMPLAHKMSTMVLIMPYHVEPLQRLEKMLNKKQLDTWMGKMKQTVVAVSLPKVSMEVSHNLQVKHATLYEARFERNSEP